MFGKKLEIKIDKMPAINKSGKIDMRGKENAVEATVTNLSDADRVLKVSCYIHLDNDPDFPDIPYLEVKMAFKDGTEEVKDSWSRRIEQEHASGDVILQEGMVKLRNEKGKLYTPVYKAMKKMSEEIARKEAMFAKETDKSRFEALMSDFAKLKKLGNIYPAVLGYGNTLAVHTSDTYSCCETVSAGIPTAISSEGIFIDKSVRADCLNMLQLMTPKYALRFEDFVSLACYMGIEPQHLHPAVLSDLPRVFAEAVRHRITETGRRRIK